MENFPNRVCRERTRDTVFIMGNTDGASNPNSVWAMLIASCLEHEGWFFIWDPVEPWFNAEAIEGFTGIQKKTLSNQKRRHPQRQGFYRMSEL